MEKCNFLSTVISFVRNISLLTYLLTSNYQKFALIDAKLTQSGKGNVFQ